MVGDPEIEPVGKEPLAGGYIARGPRLELFMWDNIWELVSFSKRRWRTTDRSQLVVE
jgi:hypothetical protein